MMDSPSLQPSILNHGPSLSSRGLSLICHPTKGRCIVATQEFHPGDELFSVKPIILLAGEGFGCIACCDVNCFGYCDEYRRYFLPLRTMLLKLPKIAQATSIPVGHLRMVLKIIAICKGDSSRSAKIDSLFSLSSSGSNDDSRKAAAATMAAFLPTSHKDTFSSAQIITLLDIIATNAVEVPQLHGAGIYSHVPLVEHSCFPNAHYDFISGNSLILSAIQTIPKGEHISISYISLYCPTSARKETLKRCYNFDCGCERCLVSAEDYTRMFFCPNCNPQRKGMGNSNAIAAEDDGGVNIVNVEIDERREGEDVKITGDKEESEGNEVVGDKISGKNDGADGEEDDNMKRDSDEESSGSESSSTTRINRSQRGDKGREEGEFNDADSSSSEDEVDDGAVAKNNSPDGERSRGRTPFLKYDGAGKDGGAIKESRRGGSRSRSRMKRLSRENKKKISKFAGGSKSESSAKLRDDLLENDIVVENSATEDLFPTISGGFVISSLPPPNAVAGCDGSGFSTPLSTSVQVLPSVGSTSVGSPSSVGPIGSPGPLNALKSTGSVILGSGVADGSTSLADGIVVPRGLGLKGPDWCCSLCRKDLSDDQLKELIETERFLSESRPAEIRLQYLLGSQSIVHPTHHLIHSLLLDRVLVLSRVQPRHAEFYLKLLIDGANKVLPPNHPTKGKYFDFLGQVKKLLGDMKGSKEAYQCALDIKEKAYGRNSVTASAAKTKCLNPEKVEITLYSI